MKTFTVLKGFLSLLLIATMISSKAQTPIGCNGQYYISHGPGSGANGNTLLDKLSFSGLTITPNPFALAPGNMGFNGMGLNPLDGFIYAIRYPATGADPRLIRISQGPGVNEADLGAIGPMQNDEIAYSGTFDALGNFYLTTSAGRFLRINPFNNPANTAGLTVVVVAATGFASFADIAVNPVDGQMYGTTNSNTDWLFAINKATGTITNVAGEPNLGGSNFFAGLFFDEVGQLFGYRSDGPFYMINKGSGALSAAGTAAAYTGADGCSCSFGRVFHDLTSQKGICPIVNNPNPEWDITVAVTNQSPSQHTGLTYTLTIPSNRFSIITDPNVLLTALKSAPIGLLPGSATLANISIVNDGVVLPASVKNKIVITGFQTGPTASVRSFNLRLKLVTTGGLYAAVPLQSQITGLPANIGSSDASNDPTTPAPDDPTLVTFCPNITLPAKLLSFTGNYKNNSAVLNWVAENQVDLAFYEVERSTDGTNYSGIGIKSAVSGGRVNYNLLDDLATETSNIFFYRLRMVDIDGKFKYSNVILVRKDQKGANGITISPNPAVADQSVTVRLMSSVSGPVELTVIDMSGRVVLRQLDKVSEGANSISLINLQRLQPGIYIVEATIGDQKVNAKLSVVR